ncbi:DUF6745 domain-containing protein [Streptomyces uncialis]|uniref:DUF6745 domain-containing protein n=1 Tax=Streptomyces uncialis TaxID=1048205 RepID=UPI0038687751|nr:hypothetical protein OG924_31075 [Streptomyces uncialis]
MTVDMGERGTAARPVGTGDGPAGDDVLARVAHWRSVGVSTEPADRPAAESGVRLAYRRAGLAEPERIVWAGSPREAVRLLSAGADALGGEPGACVRDAVRNAPWAAERLRLHDRLGPVGWSGHWGTTGAGLWESAQALTQRLREGLVEDAVAAAAPAAAPTGAGTDPGTDTATGGQGTGGVPAEEVRRRGREESEVRLLLLDAVLGQQDAAWLCAFDDPDDGPLDGIAAVARSAGWWWPYENVAVVCERPSALHRDEAGRLDRADGPALAYPDGFALYSWRGMPVPGEFLEELAGLTPDRIRLEENAELRRVMLEHYGYDRYLAESGAVPLHRDETGVLWSIPMPGDENVVMVEVVNSTPEPDGTSRTYWLRVPPATATAREGVAWTFGLSAETYTPLRQT